jgi:DNA-binding PadR family transcriptional regulator
VSVKYAVLGLLREQPDHGYRLKSRFEQRLGRVWRLNLGQVYQTLRSLEQDGLVEQVGEDSEALDAPGIHPRRRYALTEKGRRKLDVWGRKTSTVPRPIRDEILVQLLILEKSSRDDALAVISAQERVYRRHQARLAAQKRRLVAGDPETVLANFGLEAALLQTDAHLRWLAYCRAKLASASNENVEK